MPPFLQSNPKEPGERTMHQEPSITKIVITGGPCAGKTTAMKLIRDRFTPLGYTVLLIKETATELISSGVAPWTCGTNAEYQKCQVRLQLEKESIFEMGARSMPVAKVLLICDRGVMDNRAYMNDAEFAEVLEYIGTDEAGLLGNYAGVFHLATAAKSPESFYSLENNEARYETQEEAVALDNRLWEAWEAHPYHKYIQDEIDFDAKMEHLLKEIAVLLDIS